MYIYIDLVDVTTQSLFIHIYIYIDIFYLMYIFCIHCFSLYIYIYAKMYISTDLMHFHIHIYIYINIKQIHILLKITPCRSFVFAANQLLFRIQRMLLDRPASGQPEWVW